MLRRSSREKTQPEKYEPDDWKKRAITSTTHNKKLKKEWSKDTGLIVCVLCKEAKEIDMIDVEHYWPISMRNYIYKGWGPNIDPEDHKMRETYVKPMCKICHKHKTKYIDPDIIDDIKQIIKEANKKYPNALVELKNYIDTEDFLNRSSLSKSKKKEILYKKEQRKQYIEQQLKEQMFSRF